MQHCDHHRECRSFACIGAQPASAGALPDDAGATEVAFLLDLEQYPTNSILGAALTLKSHQAATAQA